MSKTYVVALDQGTTSSRAMLIDREGRVADVVQNPFPQIFPKPGWVEHDPRDILSSQLGALTELLVSNDLGPRDIDSIGITNQRETTVVWNRETGQPVAVRGPGNRGGGHAPHGPCTRCVLLCQQDPLDPRQRPRRSRGCAPGKARVRHGRLVAFMGAHAGRGARHRRHQREPHHALQHPRHEMGPVAA